MGDDIMIDWNKIKADTEAKQKKFGKFSLADVACFALIDAIDSMFSANARAEAAEAERDEARRQLAEAQMAIDVLSNTVVAQNNEIKRLRQQREDVEQYRAEIARLNQAATA